MVINRVECVARNGVPCPRCSGWYAGTPAESLEKALENRKIDPDDLQCGIMVEQAREFLKLRQITTPAPSSPES